MSTAFEVCRGCIFNSRCKRQKCKTLHPERPTYKDCQGLLASLAEAEQLIKDMAKQISRYQLQLKERDAIGHANHALAIHNKNLSEENAKLHELVLKLKAQARP